MTCLDFLSLQDVIWVSVQFSRSVMSGSLRPHESQHARPPCPSPSPGVYSNSCPLSWWFHPTISSFVAPFSCLQSFAVSGSFPMSQLFTSGGQSIGASVLVLPTNIQSWFPLGLTGLISMLCKGLSRVSSNTTKSVLSDNYFASRVPLKHWQCDSILLISDVAVEILSLSIVSFLKMCPL